MVGVGVTDGGVGMGVDIIEDVDDDTCLVVSGDVEDAPDVRDVLSGRRLVSSEYVPA